MSRNSKPGPPHVGVVHEVIALADALVAAERRSTTAWDLPRPGLPEYVALFDYLMQLPDARMTELLALFWTGIQLSSTARAYDSFDRHALRNLDHGAAYLAAKPLGQALRRGLTVLGLPPAPIPTQLVGKLQPVTHAED